MSIARSAVPRQATLPQTPKTNERAHRATIQTVGTPPKTCLKGDDYGFIHSDTAVPGNQYQRPRPRGKKVRARGGQVFSALAGNAVLAGAPVGDTLNVVNADLDYASYGPARSWTGQAVGEARCFGGQDDRDAAEDFGFNFERVTYVDDASKYGNTCFTEG